MNSSTDSSDVGDPDPLALSPNCDSLCTQSPCDNPFHVFYLEDRITSTGVPQGNAVLPDFCCPTCSNILEGRYARLDAIQVYSIKHARLVNILETSEKVPDLSCNREDIFRKEFISDPSCLRTRSKSDILCAACFGKIMPAHESVIHHDKLRQCLAAFHSTCLSTTTCGRAQCPACWSAVQKESWTEVIQELSIDERIRSGHTAPRAPIQIDSDRISAVSHAARSQMHPQFIDLVPSNGKPKHRDGNCCVCLQEILPHEPTWLHAQGSCANAHHQQCLQSWIDDQKKTIQKNSDLEEKGVTCPKCRRKYMERPEPTVEIELDCDDAETRFSSLPAVVQDEVLDREQAGYSGWPLLVWTDRLLVSPESEA